MRKLLFSAATTAIVALSMGTPVTIQSAEAMVIYPWCAHYGGRGFSGGGVNCGFISFAQCMATVSGTQGFCDGNPWWEGPVPPVAAPIYKPPRVLRY